MNQLKINNCENNKNSDTANRFISTFRVLSAHFGSKARPFRPQIRKEMMNTIANDSMMSKEMIGVMMNSKNGVMMMQEHQTMITRNHTAMMNMLKDNPGMMQNMMSDMMEAATGDTIMTSGMIKAMMMNPQIADMMQRMTGNNMMNGTHKMGGMGRAHIIKK